MAYGEYRMRIRGNDKRVNTEPVTAFIKPKITIISNFGSAEQFIALKQATNQQQLQPTG